MSGWPRGLLGAGLAGLVWLLLASELRAQAAEPPPAAQEQPEPSCLTVRCVRDPAAADDEDVWLLLARAPLAPLRLLFRTSTELLLIVPRLEDEHHVSRRVQDVFFDDTRTFGLYPTAFYETGFEPSIGARLVHRNLFGGRERLQMRGGFAGLHKQTYRADLRSGARWSPLELSLDLRFSWYDGHHFYGVGNAELSDGSTQVVPQPPAEVAIDSAYGKQELFARGGATLRIGAASLVLTQLWRRRALSVEAADDADDPRPVDEVYSGDSVAVFDRPLVDVYDEARVAWNGQRRARPNMPSALPSTGIKLTAWTGAQHELSAPRMTFGRLGLDVQPLIDLYRGDRVLRLRLRTAWVIGPFGRIPFLDLPQLGGSLLRGYGGGRFRGRGTLLASAEYRYPVQQNIAGYLFLDAGRAYLQLSELGASSLRALRVGFGGGIYAFTTGALLLRVQLASSIDGGLFLALRLDTSDGLGDTY